MGSVDSARPKTSTTLSSRSAVTRWTSTPGTLVAPAGRDLASPGTGDGRNGHDGGVGEPRALPRDVTIREQRADDADAVASVIGAAFGDASVVELEGALSDLRGGRGYVAVADEEVVGHVRLSWGWLDAPDRLVDILVLSPLSVVPSRQGHGIGQALVARAINGAEELGAPALILEGDPRFYSRCGFVAASELGMLAPSVRIPTPAFQAVPLPGHQSWMSGRVVYPDVFWRHDAVGLRGARLADVMQQLNDPLQP
jgi:putative acetyltransferase